MPRVRKARSKVYEDEEDLLSDDDDGHRFVCPYKSLDDGPGESGDAAAPAASALLASGGAWSGDASGRGGVGGAAKGPRGVPSGGLRWAVYAGVVVFLFVATFVLMATRGELGRLLANNTPANFVYVMLMQLTLLVWLIALVFRVLEAKKIPYNEVLEPSGPDALVQRAGDRSAYQTAAMAAAFSLCTAVSLGIYLTLCWDEAHDRTKDCTSGSPIAVEFASVAAVFGLVCAPWPLPMWPARRRLVWRVWQSFGCCLGRPLCGALKFVHIVVTDTLTSTCLLLWQFEFSVCLFATGNWAHGEGQDSGQGWECVSPQSVNRKYLKPIIIALPFYLRFCQSCYLAMHHGESLQRWNALKYCSALAVVFSSAATEWDPPHARAWHAAWIVSLVVKAAYCYFWDVVNDWGLFAGFAGGSGGAGAGAGAAATTPWRADHPDGPCARALLRPTRYFASWLYYGALVFNLFGRVAWSIAISPDYCQADCVLALGLLEMVRRALWILIRLENAYIALDRPIFTELGNLGLPATA